MTGCGGRWFGSNPEVIGRSYFFAGGNRTGDRHHATGIPVSGRARRVLGPAGRSAPRRPRRGGFGPRVVARMKPGTDSAALMAQLEPLARRVQQRLGGPAPYVRIMERHRPVVKPLREQMAGGISTPLWILLGTVAHRLPDRVRERGQPVHRSGGGATPRPGGAARARGATRRPGAVAGDRGAAARGGGGHSSAPCSPGRRPAPGPRGAGGRGRRLWRHTHSGPCRSAPRPARHCSSRWASRCWRPACLACCPRWASQVLRSAAFRTPAEASSAAEVGVRDALVVVQTASALILLVGSALLMRSFWQLSHVNAGLRHEEHLHVPDCRQPSRPQQPIRDVTVSIHVHGSPQGAAGCRVGGIHHHAAAGRGGRHVRTSPRQSIVASGAEAPLVRVAGTGGAYFQTMGIEFAARALLRAGGRRARRCRNVIISQAAANMLFPGEDAHQQASSASDRQPKWFTHHRRGRGRPRR